MNFKALTITGAAIAGLLSVAAQAQTPTSTKTATSNEVLENLTGSVAIERRTYRYFEGTTRSQDNAFTRVYPSIGTSLFNKKVDTSFTWAFEKKNEKTAVEKAYMYNYTSSTIYKNDFLSVTPFAETYIEGSEASFSNSYLGFLSTLSQGIDTGAGKVTFSLSGYHYSKVTSKKNTEKVEPTNRTGLSNESYLGLVGTDEEAPTEPKKVDQRDLPLYLEHYSSVSFKPNFSKKMTISTGIADVQSWTPKYENVQSADGQSVNTELDGYQNAHKARTHLNISYGINDSVSISNSLRHYTEGFYSAGYDGVRVENRLTLSATLF